MKIAIVTHPLEKNIGGIMQAYALQKKLSMNDIDVETIDFRPIQHSKLYRFFSYCCKLIQKLIFNHRDDVINENYKYRKNKIFITENVKLSPRFYKKKAISKYLNTHSFDTLVVGSDQTWRPKYVNDLSVYFLDFKGKYNKLSYAASFGVSNWEYSKEETDLASKLLCDFNSVSVRESDGICLCKTHLNTESFLVSDPTLLLSRNVYEELAKDVDILSEKKYLFYYVLDNSFEKQNKAQKVASHFGLELLIVENKEHGLFLTNTGVEIGPKEWLSLFRDSSFVITDSYHGMLFSIKFQCQFIIYGNIKRGVSRFTSLLGILGLDDRMVLSASDLELNLCENKIDFLFVDSKLSDFILASEKYLFGELSKIES